MSGAVVESLRLRKAVEVIAWAVIYQISDIHESHEMWRDYPDICERDWDMVLDKVEMIISDPSEPEFRSAYELLKARANRDEQ